MLVDSHCHLNYPGLAEDIKGTIARAMDADVNYMLCISTKLSDFSSVLATAEAFSNVACTVGIHPHESDSEPQTNVASLVNLTKHPKVLQTRSWPRKKVAIGNMSNWTAYRSFNTYFFE